MSAPRAKRQFNGAAADPSQRQITSFFDRTGTSSSSPAAAAVTTTPPTRAFNAATDPTVQANLIQVGMRVRKAVPEGYLTHKSHGKAVSSSSSRQTTPSSHAPPRSRVDAAVSSWGGLPSFCGINKVGGMDYQEPLSTPNTAADLGLYMYDDAAADHEDDDDEPLPGMTWSQDSTDSTATEPAVHSSIAGAGLPRPPKRSFAEEDSADATAAPGLLPPPGRFNIFNITTADEAGSGWQDDELSPRSLAPAAWANSRVFATPRRTMGLNGGGGGGKPFSTTGGPEALLEQENLMVLDTDEDFEEATFLDRQWEARMSDL